MTLSKMPRGYRNNNPLNIRRTAQLYVGLAPVQSDPEFFTFKNIYYGYRAVFVILRTYRNRYGIQTIEEIVRRWAPPADGNDTDIYIRMVEVLTGKHRRESFTDEDPRAMVDLVCAMSRIENGVEPSRSEVEAGWRLYQG